MYYFNTRPYKNNNTKKRKKIKRRIIILSVILLLVVSVHVYFVKFVNPIIYSVSETQVKALTHKAVNDAVGEVINSSIKYSDLIKISYDNNGKIKLIQADSIKINMLARETLSAVMTGLHTVGAEGIGIPLGTMSGMPIFSGRGPDIFIKVKPVSESEYKYYSEFKAAGINQTNHKIYFDIVSHVKAILPGRDKEYETRVTVVVSESIIIGEVPEFYLNAGKIEGSLNLVP